MSTIDIIARQATAPIAEWFVADLARFGRLRGWYQRGCVRVVVRVTREEA